MNQHYTRETPAFFLRWNLIHWLALAALLFVVMFPETGSCSRSKSTEHVSASAALAAYERLKKNKAPSREACLKVVSSLVTVHTAGHKQQAPKALLYAGRAALACYEKGRNPEDLEKAIQCFHLLIKEYDKSPFFIPGLKELKKVHDLRVRSSLVSKKQGVPTGSNETVREDTAQAKATSTRNDVTPVVPDPSADVQNSYVAPFQERPVPVYPQVSTTRVGNPFYDSVASGRTTSLVQEPMIASAPKPAKAVKPSKLEYASNDATHYVVVIDPGHGGKDPGAVSPDGSVKEKDFALEIALKIEERLKILLPGTRVILTRRDDSHLALTDRTETANAHDADLFLSIHGNAFDDPRARGVETFYLSSANSRGAMRVAARENGISLARMTDLQATLVDLNVTAKKAESAALAHEIQLSLVSFLREKGHITRDRGVKTAPFYVLLGAKMPAVLVECAFITNTNERESLARADKTDTISEGIARGAAGYLKAVGERGRNATVTACGVTKGPER